MLILKIIGIYLFIGLFVSLIYTYDPSEGEIRWGLDHGGFCPISGWPLWVLSTLLWPATLKLVITAYKKFFESKKYGR